MEQEFFFIDLLICMSFPWIPSSLVIPFLKLSKNLDLKLRTMLTLFTKVIFVAFRVACVLFSLAEIFLMISSNLIDSVFSKNFISHKSIS